MLKIILASQSPRRRKLLTQLGIKFEVIPSNIDEIVSTNDPFKLVKDLSSQKSNAISENVDNAYIIGSDTIVAFDNEILGKPNTKAEAFSMLSTLSNQTHSVFTGVSVLKKSMEKYAPIINLWKKQK